MNTFWHILDNLLHSQIIYTYLYLTHVFSYKFPSFKCCCFSYQVCHYMSTLLSTETQKVLVVSEYLLLGIYSPSKVSTDKVLTGTVEDNQHSL